VVMVAFGYCAVPQAGSAGVLNLPASARNRISKTDAHGHSQRACAWAYYIMAGLMTGT